MPQEKDLSNAEESPRSGTMNKRFHTQSSETLVRNSTKYQKQNSSEEAILTIHIQSWWKGAHYAPPKDTTPQVVITKPSEIEFNEELISYKTNAHDLNPIGEYTFDQYFNFKYDRSANDKNKE